MCSNSFLYYAIIIWFLGRPKFKISEHPDGYSAQLGFQGHYMRIRYTKSDHSIDFNVFDYKGSIKYKVTDYAYGPGKILS